MNYYNNKISKTNLIWNLKAEYRDGQVFITWKESDSDEAITYNIYMHTKPITSENIQEAQKIAGSVEKHSARDWWEDPASFIPGITSKVSAGFKINDNIERLNPLDGLFVHSITLENIKKCYYAVTITDENGVEFFDIEPGINSLVNPVDQHISTIMPIWIKEGKLPKKDSAHDKKLIISLHGRASELNDATGNGIESSNNCLMFGDSKQGWREGLAFKFQLIIEDDAVVIKPADRAWIGRPIFESADKRDHVPAINTWWYGYRDNLYKSEDNKNAVVINYTEERLLALIQWAQEYLGTDPNKTYLEGTSMGGSGALCMALHYPDKFAAVIAKVPVTAITNLGKGNLSRFEGLCGPLDNSVLTNEGIPVLERMNGILNVQKCKTDLPYIFICNGRNDPSIPWENNPPFYKALTDARQGFEAYWDDGEHNMVNNLPDDIKRWNNKYLNLAINESYPAFSNSSLNKNPGDGNPKDGDIIGWINRELTWDQVVDKEEEYSIHIKATGSEIIYPFHIDVTLRRLQNFIIDSNKDLIVTINGICTKQFSIDSNNRITIENLKVDSEDGLLINLKHGLSI